MSNRENAGGAGICDIIHRYRLIYTRLRTPGPSNTYIDKLLLCLFQLLLGITTSLPLILILILLRSQSSLQALFLSFLPFPLPQRPHLSYCYTVVTASIILSFHFFSSVNMDWSSTAAIDWNSRADIVALSQKIRAYISTVHGSVTDRQIAWGDDPGVKGPAWVSRHALPAPPEADALNRLLEAIDTLNNGYGSYKRPESAPLETQWTGHRAGVDDEAPEPSMSENEKYDALMKEVTSPVTIFYIYGGAFW